MRSLILALSVPFIVTAYSLECKGCSGIAANGRVPVAGVSVACPPRFPLGTKLHIEGVGERVCHDRGSAIRRNRLDLFVATRSEAVRWGRQTRRIWLSAAPRRPNEPRRGIGAASPEFTRRNDPTRGVEN